MNNIKIYKQSCFIYRVNEICTRHSQNSTILSRMVH